jgi:hypothetical protein
MYFAPSVKQGCLNMPMPPVALEILEENAKVYYQQNRNYRQAGRILGISGQSVQARMEQLFRNHPEVYAKYEKLQNVVGAEWLYPQVLTEEVTDGCVLVGGDAHIWPGVNTLMMKAFIKIAKLVKPCIICLNGDIIDGARVSRHGATLGSAAPKVSAEIDAAKAWMDQLPKTERRIFTIGNHDMRVDNYLANQASELEDYAGRLADRFPLWEFCYSFQINDDVEIRHRFRAGIHAAYNNAQVSGWTTVTNHTHAQQCTAVRNRRGSHWGVETGMLGDPNHKAFQYGEGATSRAHPGFALLSFDENGYLMPPEFCQMVNGRPVFRGKYVL